jgi:hypothetical protein
MKSWMTRCFARLLAAGVLAAVLYAQASYALRSDNTDLFNYVGGETGIRLYQGEVVPDNVPFVYGTVTRVYWPEISLSYCGANGYKSLFISSANDIFVGGAVVRPHFGTVISYGYFWPGQGANGGGVYGRTGTGYYDSEVVFGGGVGFLYELDPAGSFVDTRFIYRYHNYQVRTVSGGSDSGGNFNFVIAERSVFMLAGKFGIKTKVEISLDGRAAEMVGWRAYAGPCLLF